MLRIVSFSGDDLLTEPEHEATYKPDDDLRAYIDEDPSNFSGAICMEPIAQFSARWPALPIAFQRALGNGLNEESAFGLSKLMRESDRPALIADAALSAYPDFTMRGRPPGLMSEEDFAFAYARLLAMGAHALAENVRWIVHDLRGASRMLRLTRALAKAGKIPFDIQQEIAGAIVANLQVNLTDLLHLTRRSAVAIQLALRAPELRDHFFPDLVPWRQRLWDSTALIVGIVTIVVAILKAL